MFNINLARKIQGSRQSGSRGCTTPFAMKRFLGRWRFGRKKEEKKTSQPADMTCFYQRRGCEGTGYKDFRDQIEKPSTFILWRFQLGEVYFDFEGTNAPLWIANYPLGYFKYREYIYLFFSFYIIWMIFQGLKTRALNFPISYLLTYIWYKFCFRTQSLVIQRIPMLLSCIMFSIENWNTFRCR